MNKDFKEIAKKLGIAIPACLFSIGIVNAETVKENDYLNEDHVKACEISKINLSNNPVINHMIADFTKDNNKISPDHTNYHSNTGGDHVDQHSNRVHTNNHSNRNAYTDKKTEQCIPHTNTHSNSGSSVNQHTNYGNKTHTNSHTNREYKPNC